VQTSTAISAGLASSSAPLQSPDDEIESVDKAHPSQRAAVTSRILGSVFGSGDADAQKKPKLQTGGSKNIQKTVLRLDAFLGEWLSPGYFELITPPPGSVMMIAGAKAELLRREDYNSYPHFQPHHVHSASASGGSLWGSVPQSPRPVHMEVELPDALNDLGALVDSLPSRNRSLSNATDDMSSRKISIVPATVNRGGYVAPVPNFAPSSNAPIPAGYVAHARDACVNVDYQWDSARKPLEWGGGGELPEEWISMHKRFAKGIQNLVEWYSTTEHPTDMVTKTVQSNGNSNGNGLSKDDEEDDDVESVVILVSHGAGCNALVGAITHQPVLSEVAMASLTMAVRRPGKDHISKPTAAERSVSSPVTDRIAIHEYYDMPLFGNTDHIRSTASTPVSSRRPSVASPAVGFRGRFNSSVASGLGNFNYPDGGSSRSSSANVLIGGSRRASGASSRGGITVGSGVTSFTQSGLSRTPSVGLWSPAPIEVPEDACEDDDSDDMMLNFSHEKEHRLTREQQEQETPRVDPADVRADNAADMILSPTTLEEHEERRDSLPQLGLGTGGLWGRPLPPSATERLLRDTSASKRRWTVNERP